MADRKQEIKAAMTAAREKTLWLFSKVPEEFLNRRVHSFYSPIGWHFGHVGRTEEYWIICKALGRPCLDEHYSFLFADLPENPKDNRVHLPTRTEIVSYLEKVRTGVFEALDSADLSLDDPFMADGYAWEFAVQHECQHQETICEMMQLIQKTGSNAGFQPVSPSPKTSQLRRVDGYRLEACATTAIPGGSFCMGSDGRHGYDNEKCAHEVAVEPFELAATPVTSAEWLGFMADGGYEREELWTEEGWHWRTEEGARMPEYWIEQDGEYRFFGPHGLRAIDPRSQRVA